MIYQKTVDAFFKIISSELMSVKLLYRVLFAFLCIQIAIYIYSLPGREPDIDDAWIGEPAYWMLKDGHARSELMRGWTNQDERILIHHKLMTLLGYSVFKIFGFSLYSLKSVSLFFFIVFLSIFYFLTVFKRKILNRRQFLIAAIIFFTFHYTFKFSFIFRPEILMMFLTFITFFELEKSIQDRNNSFFQALIAGILSGLCAVAHLNGIAVVAAGGILLIINRKWNLVIPFSFGSIAGFSLYFYDFSMQYGFSFWKNQLFQSVLGESPDKANVLLYMANSFLKEHMRFFHDASIIGFSLLFLIMLIAGLKYIKSKHRIMLQYTIILMVIVALLFTQKSRQYILIYLPFLVIFMSVSLDRLLCSRSGLSAWIYEKKWKIIVALVVILFIGGSGYYNFKTIRNKFDPKVNRLLIDTHIKGQTADLKIIAPMEFIFNEILFFKRIQGERLYTTLQQYDKSITGIGFLEKARSFDIDYIILSKPYIDNLGMGRLRSDDLLSGYRMIFWSNEMIILKNESVGDIVTSAQN